MTQPNRPALPAQLLWGVFLFFQLMIIGLLVLLWNNHHSGASFAETMSVEPAVLANPAVMALMILAFAQIVLGVVVPNLLFRKDGAVDKSQALTAFIVRMVFFEACGLMGIVINVIGNTFVLGLFCVVLEMAAMFVFRPETE